MLSRLYPWTTTGSEGLGKEGECTLQEVASFSAALMEILQLLADQELNTIAGPQNIEQLGSALFL